MLYLCMEKADQNGDENDEHGPLRDHTCKCKKRSHHSLGAKLENFLTTKMKIGISIETIKISTDFFHSTAHRRGNTKNQNAVFIRSLLEMYSHSL